MEAKRSHPSVLARGMKGSLAVHAPSREARTTLQRTEISSPVAVLCNDVTVLRDTLPVGCRVAAPLAATYRYIVTSYRCSVTDLRQCRCSYLYFGAKRLGIESSRLESDASSLHWKRCWASSRQCYGRLSGSMPDLAGCPCTSVQCIATLARNRRIAPPRARMETEGVPILSRRRDTMQRSTRIPRESRSTAAGGHDRIAK